MAITLKDLKDKVDNYIKYESYMPSVVLHDHIPPVLSRIIDNYFRSYSNLVDYLKKNQDISKDNRKQKKENSEQQQTKEKKLQAPAQIRMDEWTGFSELEQLIFMQNPRALDVDLIPYHDQLTSPDKRFGSRYIDAYLDSLKYSLFMTYPLSIRLFRKFLTHPELLAKNLDPDENTLLHLASMINNNDVLYYLLIKSNIYLKSLINKRNKQKKTPIHLAIELNCEANVRLILESNPELTLKDNENQDALSSALRKGHPQIIASILYKRMEYTEQLIRILNKPIMRASHKPNDNTQEIDIQEIKRLLKLGADLTFANMPLRPGRTLFHIICREQALPVIECCLDHDPTLIALRDGPGYLPITYAEQNSNDGVLAFVLSQSLNPENMLYQDLQVQRFLIPASEVQIVQTIMLSPPPPLPPPPPPSINVHSSATVSDEVDCGAGSPLRSLYKSRGVTEITSSSSSGFTSSSSSRSGSGETVQMSYDNFQEEENGHIDYSFLLPPSTTASTTGSTTLVNGFEPYLKVQEDLYSPLEQSSAGHFKSTSEQKTLLFSHGQMIAGSLPMPQEFPDCVMNPLNVAYVKEIMGKNPFQEAATQKEKTESLLLWAKKLDPQILAQTLAKSTIEVTQEEEISPEHEPESENLERKESELKKSSDVSLT